jgi:hypothetical protein
MRLKIRDIWSRDLKPPATGMPPDVNNFSVPMVVSISEEGLSDTEEFLFHACIPVYSKTHPEPSLCFDEFDWTAIRERVEGILQECENCETWDEVIEQLAPHMECAYS